LTQARARRLARKVLPPVALELGRKILAAFGRWEWTYLRDGWPTVADSGWESDSILAAQVDRFPEFVESIREPYALGGSANEQGVVAQIGAHNTAMAFGYVVASCGLGRDRLSILDWGSGLGQYAVLARMLVPRLQVDYHCLDLPSIVAAGQRLLPDVAFHSTHADAFSRTYDLVMASSSLQYAHDWRSSLGQMANAAVSFLYVTRQPFVSSAPSFVVLQRPRPFGHSTQYPGWVLNRAEFLNEVSATGFRLQREFLIWESPYVANAPEQPVYRGFLFARERGDS
jgi:putative methyltransferase (TIGR04325 family)